MVWFGEMWSSGLGSSVASIMFFYTIFQQYFPYSLKIKIEKYVLRLLGFVNQTMQISFHEYSGDRLKRSEAYTTIQAYLSTYSTSQASRLTGDLGKNSKNLVFSMDDFEEVIDVYRGVKFVWTSNLSSENNTERRYYVVSFDKKHRVLATGEYMDHVMEVGKEIENKIKERRLYTNNPSNSWYMGKSSIWSHIVFEHPSTFQTLAMDEDKKKEIMDDLTRFTKSREYYARIGKSWKRGYLLYGPPGTGKSTMIAAIANYLGYDIYDLELTAVKTNNELRKLLIETSNKSLIVIEDIDCSLDLTGQRKKKNKKGNEEKKVSASALALASMMEQRDDSRVTLSGLLNFIDGIWSSCGGERIIIFTTNYIEKLDPALIRRGRMDKHIELSYCSFGAFKVLAKNYLNVDSHPLFGTIEELLSEIKITPADIAENLMQKSFEENFVEVCLQELIEVLKNVKEMAGKEVARGSASSTVDDSVIEEEEDN